MFEEFSSIGYAYEAPAYRQAGVSFIGQRVTGGDARIKAGSAVKKKLEYPVSTNEPRPAAPGACAASTSFDNDKR
jgi:hypothetical protein